MYCLRIGLKAWVMSEVRREPYHRERFGGLGRKAMFVDVGIT